MDTHPTSPDPAERPPVAEPAAKPARPLRLVALATVVLAASFWLGLRLSGSDRDQTAAAPAAVPGLANITGVELRALDGEVARAAQDGTPTIVMVSSETCGYCKRALRDMGEMSGGRPLSRLRVVTLEGAAGGVPMLRAAGVQGATSLGPASQSARTMLTFQLPGTPTFVALDARGRVTHAMVGYPGREGMASWYRAAAGEQDRP
jgi:thioredoxin-related protein